MAAVDQLQCRIAIFFRLRMDANIIREALQPAGWEIEPRPRPPGLIEASPETVVAPSTETLAGKGSWSADYVHDRFMMRVYSTLSDVATLAEEVREAFRTRNYEFAEVVRYYEFGILNQPIDVRDASSRLRSEFETSLVERIGSALGEDMGVYSVSLSNSGTPLTDQWTHIELAPEVNSPQSRLFIRVTKRAEDFESLMEFMELLAERLKRVIGIVEG